MTTQELVERLEDLAEVMQEGQPSQLYIDDLRAAASRLSEMDAENKRLREALTPFAAQTRASSWASSLTEERMILAARAALEHQQKGEPQP